MSAGGTLADGTSRLSLGGETIHHFNAVSSFAEYAVVPESVAVPIRQDVPLDVMALVGCAALTGWGAVTRIAGVEPGASVAVVGCGGVGLAIVQAARIAGAARIVAIDTQPEKLELAERLGATASYRARPTADTARRVRQLTDGGVDFAFEAIGSAETIRSAWDALRPGGTAVVVGIPPKGAVVEIDTWGFINEKSLKGCFLGSARIEEDIPRLVDLYAAGKVRLDELVTDRIALADLPTAFERLRAGEVVRQLVVL
jgi:S-(hydroxymethyl)glutathione dehydrogenase/alcohol dehydrogenase